MAGTVGADSAAAGYRVVAPQDLLCHCLIKSCASPSPDNRTGTIASDYISISIELASSTVVILHA